MRAALPDEEQITVLLDGVFLPLSQARVHPLDRGFVYGDGVYEVIPAYGGRYLRLEAHVARLERSLADARIKNPHAAREWVQLLTELLDRHGGGDASVYLQVTRGVAPRDHAFPDCPPTVFAIPRPLKPVPAVQLDQGLKAISCADMRWQWCQIKSIALQGAVLLRQQAIDVGADEAILHRGRWVTEGAASNVFAVIEGAVVTPPPSNWLLHGITRDLVLELAAQVDLRVDERPLRLKELLVADEIWLSSSTKEVLPVTRLDGVPVGDGLPGAVWRRVWDAYQALKAELRAQ
ncbi:D-amino acid aminotransferase [Immundisolibacter sp.]|uniref:D-amino acid aminotransferase n=1 Tax=Immundisolibacter sp. TaxID=1934948 RepID=UPI003568FD9E